MVAGGISFFGLSHIIFVEGTMNDFSYGQKIKNLNQKIKRKKKMS